jgi:hypothetical protein
MTQPEIEYSEHGPDPGHAQCLYCGVSFHPDTDGPGADYCSVACYQRDTCEWDLGDEWEP